MTSPLAGSVNLLDQLLAGGAASLFNLAIHAMLLAVVVWTARRLSAKDSFAPAFLQYSVMILATGALLMAGHFLEVLVWAMTYNLAGAAPPGADLVYFAFGNYTTLGYGDVILLPQWRLLSPITALNGIILIGWSTALVVDILRRTGTAPATA